MLTNMPLIVRCVPDLNDSKRMKSVMGGYPPPVEGLDMSKMTCSKCGLTEFTSDIALENHREEKHSFEARVMDAFERAQHRLSLPIDALQIEKLEKVRIE